MHSTVLARLRDGGCVSRLGRISSLRQVSVIASFDHRHGHEWIAKLSSDSDGMCRLRREYEALRYLAPWAASLSIPEILAWDESPDQICFIQTRLKGQGRVVCFRLDAPVSEYERELGPAVGWLQRFQAAVPSPFATTVACVMRDWARQLRERSDFDAALAGLLEILEAPGRPGQRPATASHGDFNPLNLLFSEDGVGACDWESFRPGGPLDDLFALIANPGYFEWNRGCTMLDRYRHVFFSDSGACRFARQHIEAMDMRPEELRIYFCCFLATQLSPDKGVPAKAWLDFIRKLDAAGYPPPCSQVWQVQ